MLCYMNFFNDAILNPNDEEDMDLLNFRENRNYNASLLTLCARSVYYGLSMTIWLYSFPVSRSIEAQVVKYVIISFILLSHSLKYA